MNDEERERKVRSDKGLVMATARDLYCIGWIAEQYAARADQIQKLLSRFPSEDRPFKNGGLMAATTLRDQIARWKRAGWIDYRRTLADEPGYAWATRRGLQLVGLDTIFTAREPASTRLNHIYAVNQLRLWMDGRYENSWKSERRYKSEQLKKLKKGESLEVIPDGQITKDGSVIAIEAELSAKKPADVYAKLARLIHRYESTGLGYEAAFPTIWFYVPNESMKKLIQSAIADLRNDEERQRVAIGVQADLIASRYRRR
jgi:hypothetical protein